MSSEDIPMHNPGIVQGGKSLTVVGIIGSMALRAIFSFVQRAIVAPVDRLALLTAVEGELVRQGRLSLRGFGGVMGCIKRVWKKEGATGFFRGLLTDAVLSVPSSCVDLVSTNAVFWVLQSVIPPAATENMGTGAIVALALVGSYVSVWVATPYNAIRKTIVTNYSADIVAPMHLDGAAGAEPEDQQQGEKDKKKVDVEESSASPLQEGYRYASASDAAQSMWRRGGWRAFYRGAMVEPLTICTYRTLYIAASLLLSTEMQMYYPYTVARGLAIVADIITQPLEVISRRLVLTASDDSGRPPYEGMIDCARKIVAEEGIASLWSGLRFRLLVSGVSIAVNMLYTATVGGQDA